MNILIIAATKFEIEELYDFLRINGKTLASDEYRFRDHTFHVHVTGVGSLLTSFAISRLALSHSFDLAINVGIAGSFNNGLTPGTVVEVVRDAFADLGSENADGSFNNVFEMNLMDKNTFPFSEGWLYPKTPTQLRLNIPKANGITVNMVSGNQDSINRMKEKYLPDVESMEGAGFFYACMMLHIPSVQIRAISNYVEPRNKSNWKMEETVTNLNNCVIDQIKSI
ncbi:MAG: futalosine hydrolase [Saprospiraceae bacterium]|nr:futalosine hydrolase [Saprospiraceae bacterium]